MVNILISEHLNESTINKLQQYFNVDYKPTISYEELLNCINKYHAILIRNKTQVNKEMLDKAENLKLISRAGTGLDNIDLEEVRKKNITVTDTNGLNANSVAEFVFGLMLTHCRNIISAHSMLKQGVWKNDLFGFELRNKSLGLVGFGNIGKRIAEIALTFKMDIYVFDPFITQEIVNKYHAKNSNLQELFNVCDIISVQTPLTNETRDMIGYELLSQAPNLKCLVNVGRGEVINEKDLIACLKQRQDIICCLDVFKDEPYPNKDLISLPNVISTPHIAAKTYDCDEEVSHRAAKNIIKHFTN